MGITWLGYDDFSGGYYVDERDADQPRNTWTGDNIMVDPQTGYLMPMPTIAEAPRYPTDYTDTPADTNNFSYPIRYPDTGSTVSPADLLWAQQDSGTSWRVWTGGIVGSFNVARSAATITLGYNSEWTNAVPALASTGGTQYAWLPYAGGHIVNWAAAAFTNTAVTSSYNRVALWNNRMVTWFPYGSNNLYYSDANAYTTWPAVNVYQIGDDQPIVTVVVSPQALWIGKRTGWWELRGTLGTSATINQLVTICGPVTEPAVRLQDGQILFDGLGNAFNAIQGIQPRKVNARRPAPNFSYGWDFDSNLMSNHMVRVSASGLFAGYTTGLTGDDKYTGWIYDSLHRRWMRYKLPTALQGNGVLRWAWDHDGYVSTLESAYPTTGVNYYDPIYGVLSGTSSRNKVVGFQSSLNFPSIPADIPATVTLAEHSAPPGTLERVADVIVEVVSPDDASVYNGIEVTCRIQAVGIPDVANDLEAEPFSDPHTWERHGQALADGARYLIRFKPTNLAAAAGFRPEITLTNCKLRRVLLAIDRSGGVTS